VARLSEAHPTGPQSL